VSNNSSADKVTLRIVLYKDEVARLPRDHRRLVVREGVAWITREGEDTILRAGDNVTFRRGKWATVVSAIDGPLVIEVLGADHPRSPAISRVMRHRQVAGGAA